jgi:hypothetical protein
MKSSLQQAIRINRQLVQKTTSYHFKVAETELEEEYILKDILPTENITILRLYERSKDK